MKTVTKNIHEEDKKFRELHKQADEVVHGKDGNPSHVVYYFPSRKFGDIASPNGNFKLPDMDYYNSPLLPTTEMEDLMDEMRN